MGPAFATNRRKFTVVMGIESGSRVESRGSAPFPFDRGVDGAFAGSCNAEDNNIDVRLEPPPFEGDIGCALAGEVARTGECSGRGRDVTILGAGRRSLLGLSERSRVAYDGTST